MTGMNSREDVAFRSPLEPAANRPRLRNPARRIRSFTMRLAFGTMRQLSSRMNRSGDTRGDFGSAHLQTWHLQRPKAAIHAIINSFRDNAASSNFARVQNSTKLALSFQKIFFGN